MVKQRGKRFNILLVETIRTYFRGNRVENIITISVIKSQKKLADEEVNFELSCGLLWVILVWLKYQRQKYSCYAF